MVKATAVVERAALMWVSAAWTAAGVAILAMPGAFYELTPGLSLMGPFNVHFIRDVALAFLASGAATFWGAWRRDRSFAIAGAAWPFLHSLFHLHVWGHRGFPFDGVFCFDAVFVIAPAWLALILAWRTA